MSTLETESTHDTGPSMDGPHHHPHPRRPARRKSFLSGLFWFLVMAGGAAGLAYEYRNGRLKTDAVKAVAFIREHLPSSGETTTPAEPTPVKPRSSWDGFVNVTPKQAAAIGLKVVKVEPQIEPIKLELTGRTDYDPNSLTKIRPRFDTLVVKVLADLGQKVRKGDPLLELFSTELAQAKNDYQTAYVQWRHDARLLEMREKLFKEKAIAEQLLVDTRNDENKSRLALATAREKLKVFEVPEEEIDQLVKNLGDDVQPGQIFNVAEKAKMTRRSPVDGIIIQREVVAGNLYDTNDVLMVIAPLDHLFVWVNVYERDQPKVYKGQKMQIQFRYLNLSVPAKVEYVSSEVSKETRAVSIRASIPNVNGELKANMLVRALLEIPPIQGQTVIPRLAMVVMGGNEYSFVRKPPTNSKEDEQFERRNLFVAQENSDIVVVKSGLTPGEEVASNGSLILSQLYEDQQMVETGLPTK